MIKLLITVRADFNSGFCYFEIPMKLIENSLFLFTTKQLNKMGLRYPTKSQIKGTLTDFKDSANWYPKLGFSEIFLSVDYR